MKRKTVLLSLVAVVFAVTACKTHYEVASIQRTRIVVDNRFDRQPDQQAADFLAARYAKIGMIAGQEKTTDQKPVSDSRRDTFAKTLKAKNLYHSEWFMMGDYSEKSGFDQMQRLLQLDDRPQAVLVANDAMAVGALRALHEKQIDVPREMALISFDDTSITHYTYPTLTSIHVPTDQMAAMGLELLGRRLQNPDLAPQRVVVGTKLVLRQSTEK